MSNEKHTPICEVCGAEFQWRARKANRFCSKKCQHTAVARPQGTCESCGGSFKTEWGKPNRFCSQPCHTAYIRKNPRILALRDGIDPVCEVCGTHFKKRGGNTQANRFCSRACYLIAHANEPKLSRVCVFCQKEFSIKPFQGLMGYGKYCGAACRKLGQKAKPRHCSVCKAYFTPINIRFENNRFYVITRNDKKICSNACLRAFYRTNEARKQKISVAFTGSKHPAWLGGNENWRGENWHKIREQVRKKAKYRCELCGMSQEENGRKLDVNHKIPWRNFTNGKEANRSSNLEALCICCHRTVEPRKNVQMLLGFMVRKHNNGDGGKC